MGNHQKCWLWGRHAVLETLRAEHWVPFEIAIAPEILEEAAATETLVLARRLDIDIAEMTSGELGRLCGTTDHQGIAAKMPPYPYADPAAVLNRLGTGSFVLVLAGIQDPFNFGAILRSADLFGVDAVFVPTAGQAAVSSHVARSSVGAVNYLQIVQSPDLTETCRNLQQQGIQIIGASEKGDRSPARTDLQRATALLIGNEGSGIPEELLTLCDAQICIPQQGHVGSFNAAVAAGILCYEVRRQREA
ncbi:23S rRNA (guanosine(2251)-2'-O)-methyltransferase RlmB [Planctomicrobium sp. SH661]|uniref:23S rRNA (guanosine(2251)-2'-O)-methyltransferase RlmB n=1 Tax=Planctomicrobium sp. SH661 TaxID=3448124 RepID=UPI003F5B4556